MEPGLIWILGGLLLGAEMVIPGIFLLWIGLAAIGTGMMLLLVMPPFVVTVAVFLALLAGGIAVALRLRREKLPRPHLNTPDAGLVGRAGIMLAAEAPALRVRVGDSDWAARLPRDVPLAPPGTTVRVEAVDGTTLVVRPE